MRLDKKYFYCLTEIEYYTLLIGNKNKSIKHDREQRDILWSIACSYADPKKLPKTIYDFMPLEGDPEKKQISKERIMQADNKFRNLGKK